MAPNMIGRAIEQYRIIERIGGGMGLSIGPRTPSSAATALRPWVDEARARLVALESG